MLTSTSQVPIIALGCCAVLLVPKQQKGPVVALRLVMFAGLAVPGLAAIIHGRVIKVKAGARKAPISLWWIITTGVLNAAGAVVYAAKVCCLFNVRVFFKIPARALVGNKINCLFVGPIGVDGHVVLFGCSVLLIFSS